MLLLTLLAALGANPSAIHGMPQLVETAPVETTLEHADIPDAWQVWPEMIGAAQHTLDIAQFYVSSERGKRMEPVLAAIEAALARGVKVRLISDLKFVKTYPESLARLEQAGAQVLRIDFAKIAGGVQHAKYFVVDGAEVYIGSQNFDWRSLEHIQELGVRVREPALAARVLAVFERDWAVGRGEPAPVASAPEGGWRMPFAAGEGAGALSYRFVASPKGALPDDALWELPAIVEMIDGARSHVRVQLLTYKASSREGGYWEVLESALRRAAARNVKVELLVSNWCQRKYTIEGLQSLEVLPNVDVKLVAIPEWSGGFVSFARTVHAKYMVVDGAHSWIGTSNWEEDYFTKSRNLGLIVDGSGFAEQLERFFADGWSSAYAAPVDPARHYEAPRIGE